MSPLDASLGNRTWASAPRTAVSRILVCLLAFAALTGGCASGDSAPDSELTVRRETDEPLGTEGATMVVRVLDGSEVIFEDEVGNNYEPAVARVTVPAGTYTVHVAQRICSENCGPTGTREDESLPCSIEVTADGKPLEIVATVDRFGCDVARA